MSRRAIIAVVAILAAAPCVSAQSLGDLAKRTQADREKAAGDRDKTDKAAKTDAKQTFTDKDLKTLDPLPGGAAAATAETKTGDASPPPTGQKDAAAPTTGATATEMIDAANKGEEYWRGRLRPLLTQLAADADAALQTATRLRELQDKVEPNLPSLAVFGPEITRLTTELQKQDRAVTLDQAAIDALKEEGRRAGALPGWFR
jgi:hypothetical protein